MFINNKSHKIKYHSGSATSCSSGSSLLGWSSWGSSLLCWSSWSSSLLWGGLGWWSLSGSGGSWGSSSSSLSLSSGSLGTTGLSDSLWSCGSLGSWSSCDFLCTCWSCSCYNKCQFTESNISNWLFSEQQTLTLLKGLLTKWGFAINTATIRDDYIRLIEGSRNECWCLEIACSCTTYPLWFVRCWWFSINCN